MPDDDDDPDASGEEAAALALATAQSILDAAEITLPTGDLANGAYDALGNYYPLPEPIVSDPTNVVRDGAPSIPIGSPGGGNVDDAKVDHLTTTAAEDGDETADEDEDEEEAERRREEKGKAVIDVRDQLSVDARLSGDGRDVVVMISKTDTVRVLARRVLEESGVSDVHFF